MFADRDELRVNRQFGQEVICDGCKQTLRVFANDVMNVVEERAGLTEERRRALEYLTDLAVNDPEKALKLRNLDERVESLQREVANLKWFLAALVAVFSVVAAILVT